MPLDPITIGASIIGGSSLLSGLLGASGAREANRISLENAEKDRALQKEFAQMGIRWRAQDAQAAGLHPLYALGAQIPTYSPSPISVMNTREPMSAALREAGQNIGGAFMRLQLEALKASAAKDFTQAQLNASEAGRVQQEGAAVAMGVSPGDVQTRDLGLWQFKPVEVQGSRIGSQHVAAGPAAPGMSEYVLSTIDGRPFKMLLPSAENVGEAFESMTLYTWPTVIKINMDYYGSGWLDDAATVGIPGYSDARNKALNMYRQDKEDIRRLVEQFRINRDAYRAWRRRIPER